MSDVTVRQIVNKTLIVELDGLPVLQCAAPDDAEVTTRLEGNLLSVVDSSGSVIGSCMVGVCSACGHDLP